MPAADDAEWLLPEEWDKSNGANRGPVRKRATLMPSSSADSLLFDLGRVVIDIDFNRAFSRWAGHARCDQKLIRERCLALRLSRNSWGQSGLALDSTCPRPK